MLCAFGQKGLVYPIIFNFHKSERFLDFSSTNKDYLPHISSHLKCDMYEYNLQLCDFMVNKWRACVTQEITWSGKRELCNLQWWEKKNMNLVQMIGGESHQECKNGAHYHNSFPRLISPLLIFYIYNAQLFYLDLRLVKPPHFPATIYAISEGRYFDILETIPQ